jgi:transposase-like protein
MNKLPIDTRAKILHMLVEGNSLRATSRMADVAYNSVLKLVSDAGERVLRLPGYSAPQPPLSADSSG